MASTSISTTRLRRWKRSSACSILELLVVLTIMIALALIVIPMFGDVKVVTPSGESESPVEIATTATLNAVRDALVGEDGVLESLSHKSNALPRKVNDLTSETAPSHIQETAPELVVYDPVNRIGWNGPYMVATGMNEAGEPTVVDGWGNEIQIQADFDENGEIDQTESKYMRIVSAGPNGKVETPADHENMKPGNNEFNELTRSECGDDLVIFVRVPDQRQ